jgi:probable selenium-dependent hydroxylase accessory protein YqeC
MLAAKGKEELKERLVSLREAFAIGPQEVVSLVGAGGKTTLMYALARQLAQGGGLVVTTTTTKIMPPSPEESDALLLAEDEVALEEQVAQAQSGVITLARRLMGSGKLEGVSPELVDRLAGGHRPVRYLIVEADGAARRPLKAPNATEPVIPDSSTLVVTVVGLEALGKPLDEAHVFRAAIAAELLGIPLGSTLRPEAIARLITCEQGLAKGSPPRARIVPFLNKVETVGMAAAREVAQAVLDEGHPQIERVVLGEARRGDYWLVPSPAS